MLFQSKSGFQRQALVVALVAMAGYVQAQSPASAPKQAAGGANMSTPVSEGDSIDQRAQRARLLEEARSAEALAKLKPAQSQISPPAAVMPRKSAQGLMPVIAPPPVRNEFFVEAIRGFEDKLEAALLINGRRVTASTTFPTLIDGWAIESISVNGVVITKGKERQSLAFVGHDPLQPLVGTAAGQGVGFNPAMSGIPPGTPGAFPTPGR